MQNKTAAFIGILTCITFGLAHAQLERAPLNPAFVEYVQQQKNATLAGAESGRALGYVPAPVKITASRASRPALKDSSLPAKYDLRTQGKLTPIKDQRPYGTCWAFATYGSMESYLLPWETCDFSENNLANLHGFDFDFDVGGNSFMSMAYLARWSGPVSETDDPYPNPGASPVVTPVRKHIQNAIWLPKRFDDLDNDLIKQMILEHGALYSAMYWNDSYFQAQNNAYYYMADADANHGICIVGWDDNFDRNKFKTPPPGNGAFLIRNSWGTAFGNNGYFWISYYDSVLGNDENFMFLNAEPTNNYQNIYQYDDLGWCSSVGYGSDIIWGANIFSNVNDKIRAVGFYATGENTRYKIRVYNNVTANQPTNGTLACTVSGTARYAGYYTVQLPAPVAVTSAFSVVMKFYVPNYDYPLPFEDDYRNYSSQAVAKRGESFVSPDGISWEDAKWDENDYFNVCIKAYGGATTPPASALKVSPATGSISQSGGSAKFTVSANVPWIASVNASWLTLTPTKGNGNATLTATAKSANNTFTRREAVITVKSRDITRTVKVTQLGKEAKLTVSPASQSLPLTGGSVKFTVSANTTWSATANAKWLTLSPASGNGNATLTATAKTANNSLTPREAVITVKYGSKTQTVKAIQQAKAITPQIADFDGDRQGDPTLYDTLAGGWAIRLSAAGWSSVNFNYRQPGNQIIPLAGDFDGDGCADPSVFDTATRKFNVALSSSGYHWLPVSFKQTSIAPVCADFDGDRLSDLAFAFPNANKWVIYASSRGWSENGIYKITWPAANGDLFFAGDFDGDGFADPTYYHVASGKWNFLLSSGGYSPYGPLPFGGKGYTPAVGDFDGDGRADLIQRDAQGNWYVLMSSSGYQSYFQFKW